MKPYDQITKEQVIKWGTPIILTLLLAGFFLIRPITYYQDEIGFAFCNPILWLLGQDHLMWERTPDGSNPNIISFPSGLFCALSFAVHIAIFAFPIAGLIALWKRAFKRPSKW